MLVLPQPFRLSTADVYREADRLGLARPIAELRSLLAGLEAALRRRPSRRRAPVDAAPVGATRELIVNDLQPAAVSLAPRIADALVRREDAGADRALVCGSGPTVIGLYLGSDGVQRARGGRARSSGPASGALRESARPAEGSARPTPKQ